MASYMVWHAYECFSPVCQTDMVSHASARLEGMPGQTRRCVTSKEQMSGKEKCLEEKTRVRSEGLPISAGAGSH